MFLSTPQKYYPYDFLAQTYAPDECRFWQPDPLATDNHGISPYIFCGGDPVNYVDPDGKRIWPVDEEYNGMTPRHSNNFGMTGDLWRSPHTGVDINIGYRSNDDLDAPVYATHDGEIIRLVNPEDLDGGGIRISIKSLDGKIMTSYMHLNSTMENLSLGDFVEEGQQIGNIGNTGHSTGPHLHYEIWQNEMRINPANGKDSLLDPQKLLNIDNKIYRGTLNELTVTDIKREDKIAYPQITINIENDIRDAQIYR